jgi:uncharacterized protein YerC
MVHVSDIKLKAETLKKLQTRFADSITTVSSHEDAMLFIDELLGLEEKLMLAKRLAIIYMLSEEISAYRIAQVLGVSSSTVNKMRLVYSNDGYDSIVRNYKHKSNHATFWFDIEVLLRLGMPERGKGRWKYFNALCEKNR